MNEIDTYLETLDTPERDALQHLRKQIHQAAPDITECISYGMPGFKYKKKYLAGFCAFKDHLSFFPGAMSPEVLASLSGYKTSKGTIQFAPDHVIPKDIIEQLLQARITAIDSPRA